MLSLRLRFLASQPNFEFLTHFESLVNAAFGVELTNTQYISQNFRQLIDEGRTPPLPFSPEYISGANILSDRATRTLAIAIKSSGGILVRDIGKQMRGVHTPVVNEKRKALQDGGLITNELVVICKKTQAQVVRADTQGQLNDVAAHGIRCSCGANLQDEKIEEVLTSTELGRNLLDGSHWLSILLCEELFKLGVARKSILLEQQAGGDEIDCIADISGKVALFELKDKEFNLGSAYSFGAKIAIIQPEFPVILTTETVGNDAKEHFNRAGIGRTRTDQYRFRQEERPSPLHYIEGVEQLKSRLEEIVEEIYTPDALRILSQALNGASVPPAALLKVVRNNHAGLYAGNQLRSAINHDLAE